MFHSNYGPVLCLFWDIQCLKILQPWNPGKGSIRVIESGIIRWTGYGFLVVFYSNLSILESDLETWLRGSLKVIGTDTDQSAAYDFLLTFHSNHGPISYCFPYKRWFQLKIANFPHPMYFATPLKGFPMVLGIGVWNKKLRVIDSKEKVLAETFPPSIR